MAQQPYDGRHFGRSRCECGVFSRHRHDFGYICVVLGGRFTEAGDTGRFRIEPGDVMIHRPHEAHLDVLGSDGAVLLNLPLIEDLPTVGRIRVRDVDRIAVLAEHDPLAAARAVAAGYHVVAGESDWPDLLALALSKQGALSIGDWARHHALSPEAVSRGFRQAYGTSPIRYRAEARARRAWRAVATTDRRLVDLAFDLGFADQAHMTRSLKQLTGRPPGHWRARGQFGSRPPGETHLA